MLWLFLFPLPDLPECRGSQREWPFLWSPQLLLPLHLHLHPEERGQGEVQHRGRARVGQSSRHFTIFFTIRDPTSVMLLPLSADCRLLAGGVACSFGRRLLLPALLTFTCHVGPRAPPLRCALQRQTACPRVRGAGMGRCCCPSLPLFFLRNPSNGFRILGL